jgi:hypothetical protein
MKRLPADFGNSLVIAVVAFRKIELNLNAFPKAQFIKKVFSKTLKFNLTFV